MNRMRWTADRLTAALADGTIVPLPEADWERLAAHFPVAQAIETGIAGPLLVVRRPVPGKKIAGWAIVERPQLGERVVRPLPDQPATKALVADRLKAYERMWDG